MLRSRTVTKTRPQEANYCHVTPPTVIKGNQTKLQLYLITILIAAARRRRPACTGGPASWDWPPLPWRTRGLEIFIESGLVQNLMFQRDQE